MNKGNFRHGHAKNGGESRAYISWKHMRGRCLRKTHKDYRFYGGRGIRICKRWRKFENFLADMGDRPEGLTLERKNNNRGYCKSNCRWATRKDQVANKNGNFIKGQRGLRGANAPWAKLRKSQVRKIRRLCGKVAQRVIAKRFGIAQSMVSFINTGASW